MLTYAQQDQKVSEEPFVRRVAQAGVAVATAVMAELVETAGHAERAAFAQRMLNSPVETGRMMARAVVTNPNAGTGASDPLTDDGALEFVVSSLWNAYAGYSAAVGGMAMGWALPTKLPEMAAVVAAAEPETVAEPAAPAAQPTFGSRLRRWFRDPVGVLPEENDK